MKTLIKLTLATIKMYFRNKGALIWTLFFPIVVIGIFGLLDFAKFSTSKIGFVYDESTAQYADGIEEALKNFGDQYKIEEGSIEKEKQALTDDDRLMVLEFSPAEETGKIGVELIGEIRRFKASKKMPLNAKIKTLNIYTPDSALIGQIENLDEDIKGTMRIESLGVMTGKPDIKEKVVEIIPVMAKIGPEFKGDAPKIVKYLQSEDMDEIVATLDDGGEITIEGNKLTWDHIEAKKVAVGKTGEKVEVIHAANLDVILEVIV